MSRFPASAYLLRTLAFFATCGLIFAAWPGNAAPKAQEASALSGQAASQTISYAVYGGGLKALTAELDIVEPTPDSYRLAMASQTSGLARFLSSWQGTMTTMGSYINNAEQPGVHEVISVWPDNTQIKRFSYGDDGSLQNLKIIEGGKNTTPPQAATLANDTVDLMTAVLKLMETVSAEGHCDNKTAVFDGKRRFIMQSKTAGEEMLNASRYNTYKGPAVKCEMKIIPVAGDWHEKLKGWMAFSDYGQEAGTLPVVWMGWPNGGGDAIPVKMRAKTKYGTFFVHLQEYQNGHTQRRADLQ